MPKQVDIRNLTLVALSECLGHTVNQLFAISNNIESRYKPTRKFKSASGKLRELDVPKPFLKGLLRKLHRFIQRNGWYSASAHGGVQKRSAFTSAKNHLGTEAVAVRDVTNCYPSVSESALHQSLLQLGVPPDTTRLLSKLLTCRGRIPQGAPTSGDAINLYLFSVDEEMRSICGSDVAFTRMVDDNVLSGPTEKVEFASDHLESLLSSKGLSINESKKNASGMLRSSGRQNVHSIGVNHPTKTRIPKDRDRTYRDYSITYVNAARCVSPDSLPSLAAKRRQLLGYINYSSQADISPARFMRQNLIAGDRFVRNRLLKDNVTRSKKWWGFNGKHDQSLEISKRWKDKSLVRKGITCGESGSNPQMKRKSTLGKA